MPAPAVAGEPGIAAYSGDIEATWAAGRTLARTSGVTDVVVHCDVDGTAALLRASGDVATLEPVVDTLGADAVYRTSTRALLRHRRRWDLGDPSPGVGTIFQVRRHPDLSVAAFHEHWEHSHGPVALRHHLGMWDYRQLSVVETLAGPELDGIAVVQWPTDDDRRARFFDDERGAAVVSADASAFTDRTNLLHHLMVEHLLADDVLPLDGAVEITDHRSLSLSVAPTALWSAIGAFSAVLDWWPSGLVSCEVDDPAHPTTRVLSRSDGTSATERLVHHRDDERMFVLEVIDGLPDPIRHYTCRYEVRAIDDRHCRLDWQPRAAVDQAQVGLFATIVDAGWNQIETGLRRYLRSPGRA